MTATSKALRKLARARMKQTGETYSTALAALRADALKHARTFVCRWCKRAQVGAIVSTGVILGRRQCPLSGCPGGFQAVSDTTIHNRPGASIVRAFRRINAAAEVIAAARALVLHIRSMRQSARDPIMRSADWYDMQADTSKTNLDRLDAAITAYDATEGT